MSPIDLRIFKQLIPQSYSKLMKTDEVKKVDTIIVDKVDSQSEEKVPQKDDVEKNADM